MPTWLVLTLSFGGLIALAFLIAIPVNTLIDEFFKMKARDRFYDSINTTFNRGLLSADRLKLLARGQQLNATDLRRVVVRLLQSACLGKIERKEEDDVREIEGLLRELEEEDPFQSLPAELKGPLQRISSALTDKDMMEPLIAHLREFSIANRKEKRRSYAIAIVGVVLSIVSIQLAFVLK